MAKKIVPVVLLTILLATLNCPAQATQPVYFKSFTYTQDDLQAGFDQGIVNPLGSGKIVYLDKVTISLGFDDDSRNPPYVIFGTAVGLQIPANCTTYATINQDLADPGQQSSGGVTSLAAGSVIGQPCSGPVSTGNLGAVAGTYIDNFACIVSQHEHLCTIDMTKKPLALLPGRGYFIYSKPGFFGTPVFGFEWHE